MLRFFGSNFWCSQRDNHPYFWNIIVIAFRGVGVLEGLGLLQLDWSSRWHLIWNYPTKKCISGGRLHELIYDIRKGICIWVYLGCSWIARSEKEKIITKVFVKQCLHHHQCNIVSVIPCSSSNLFLDHKNKRCSSITKWRRGRSTKKSLLLHDWTLPIDNFCNTLHFFFPYHIWQKH